MKKRTIVWLCVTVGIVIVTVATIMINSLVLCDGDFVLKNQNGTRLNIFDTKFGQTYKEEVKEMNGVEFFSKVDDKTGKTILKIKTNDSIDNNIILTHMVYSNLGHILPNIDCEKICIIAYDESGMFFKWNDFNLDFTQAFTRKDYIVAVEKKEKMLYNHSVRTE